MALRPPKYLLTLDSAKYQLTYVTVKCIFLANYISFTVEFKIILERIQ